jgi:hypothetical protein
MGCLSIAEFHKKLEEAKNKGELIAVLREYGSFYGMHSGMPKHLWDKLEASTSRFYR